MLAFKSNHATTLFVLLLLLGLIATLTILVIGQLSRHRGQFNPTLVEIQGTHHIYQGRIESASKIFRGNDIFSVSSPTLEPAPENLVFLQWIPEDIKGKGSLITVGPLTVGELETSYDLSIRWEKVTPYLFVLALLGFTQGLCQLRGGELQNHLRAGTHFDARQTAQSARQTTANAHLGWRHAGVTSSAYALLSFMLAVHFVAILWPVGWILGDAHFILANVVQGKFLPGGYFPSVGRFFPLGFLDLNLFLSAGDQPLLYQLERAVLFMVLIGTIYLLAKRRCGAWIAALLISVFLTTSELLRIFADVIFPEVLLSVALVIFFWSYRQTVVSGGIVSAVATILTAILATYCKEPVFGALLVFAFVQIMGRWKTRSKTLATIHFLLILNAVLFLAVYFRYGMGEANYIDIQTGGESVSRTWMVLKFLRQPILALMMVWGTWRGFRFFFGRERDFVFEDGALLSGCAYVVAFVILGLTADYYLVPAYVFCFVALPGYFTHPSQVGSARRAGTESLKNVQLGLPHLPRAAGLALFGLLAIGCLQFANVFKGMEFVINQRRDTLIINQAFIELAESKYELYVYLAPEMSRQDRGVQRWRRTLLNIFYSNEQAPAIPFNDRGDTPIGELTVDIKPTSERFLIIHDARYGTEGLRDESNPDLVFVRIPGLPLILGAHAVTAISNLEEVETIVARRIP